MATKTAGKNTIPIRIAPAQYAIRQSNFIANYLNLVPSPSVEITHISTILHTHTANKGSKNHPVKSVIKSCQSPR